MRYWDELWGNQFFREIRADRGAMAAQGHSRDERLPVQTCEAPGDFIWHDHKETDETFIVIDGVLRIDLRGGAVEISAGEMFVVPKGVEHKPYAHKEVKLLLIEPRGTPNTGDEGAERSEELKR